MRIRHGTILALLLAGAAAAQEPKPQYSVDDIVGTFRCEGADCARGARVEGSSRGFSLARPGKRGAAKGAGKPRPQTRDLLITFANASAELTPQARANARVFAAALNTPALAAARFAIEGHTNAVGGRAYNLELSQQRAQALADELVRDGVGRDRLQTAGYGFDRPRDRRHPAAAGNRRVEARRLR